MHRHSLRGVVLALSACSFLALLWYACAVNPVTGRSELSLVSFSEAEEA